MTLNLKPALLAVLALSSTAALAEPTLEMDCAFPGFGVTAKVKATLAPSNPDDHIEQYVLRGVVDYNDPRPDLDFRKMGIFGTFDNTRGVTRISFRPIAPLMFGTLSNLSVLVMRNGHQLYNISSEDDKGPNGGGNGPNCQIEVSGL